MTTTMLSRSGWLSRCALLMVVVAGAAALVGLPAGAVAQAPTSFDGTYVSDSLERPAGAVIETLDVEITVTVTGRRFEGVIVHIAITRQLNIDQWLTQRAVQTIDISGTVDEVGLIEGAGLTRTEYELLDCEPDDKCLGAQATQSAHPEGVPVAITGSIGDGIFHADLVNSVSGAMSAFDARRPGSEDEPGVPTPMTPADTTPPDERAAADAVGTATAPGIVERDGKIYISSEAGRPLEISRSELPPSIRETLATVGALVVVVGPPETVITGDPFVLIDGLPAARVGDQTDAGGLIVKGSSRVFINGVAAATIGEAFAVSPMVTGIVPRVGGPVATTGSPGCDGASIAARYGTADVQAILDRCAPEANVRFELTRSATEVGARTVDVRGSRFSIGDEVAIGNDPESREHAVVVDTGSIVLDRPLASAYPAGSVVQRISTVAASNDSDQGAATGLILLVAGAASAALLGALIVWRTRLGKRSSR